MLIVRIDIKVIPNAKRNLVKEENGLFKVYLTAPAVEGKANKALMEVLSEHFGVKRHQIGIR